MQNDKEKFKKEFIRRLINFSISIIRFSEKLRDYIKFFEIALKSANETKYWLIITKELTKNKKEAEKNLRENIEITKIIASSVLTLKGKK